jgi:hypothetical protein
MKRTKLPTPEPVTHARGAAIYGICEAVDCFPANVNEAKDRISEHLRALWNRAKPRFNFRLQEVPTSTEVEGVVTRVTVGSNQATIRV